MTIRIKHSVWRIAALVMVLAGGQTAKKPVSSLLPQAQGAPPPIQAQTASSPKPAAQTPTDSSAPAPQKTEQAVSPQPVAKPDPIQDLITKAETEYAAGLAQYDAGKKDEAKEHFDRAFNLLLSSPADIRSDARFQREFDRVLDGVNKLELATLQQSDNTTEQKPEPAPIDDANEVTNYPVDPNIKAQATPERKATHS